ncbi:hypothetical protein D3C77_181240 [compost metagenome]
MIAQEHQVIRLRQLGTVVVALHSELLELLGVVDALLDHEAAHHAAGLFGVEADDLVLAVLDIAELGVAASMLDELWRFARLLVDLLSASTFNVPAMKAAGWRRSRAVNYRRGHDSFLALP